MGLGKTISLGCGPHQIFSLKYDDIICFKRKFLENFITVSSMLIFSVIILYTFKVLKKFYYNSSI